MSILKVKNPTTGEWEEVPAIVGPTGPQGPQGEQGLDGKDGITPHIGDNGNWFIGETDTEMPSQGETVLQEAVLYTPQLLTEKQKAQVIQNVGAVPAPMIATVGQTIVVKAVDENGVPTEWEAADLGSGGVSVGTEWSVVLDTTLTEETSVIRQDVSGYSEYVIFLRTVPGSGSNKSTVTVDVWTGTSGASAERYSVNDAVWNDGKTKITTQAHFIKPSGATAIYGEITRKGIASNHGGYGFVGQTNLITKFEIFTNQNDNAFGVGTQIQIYGR